MKSLKGRMLFMIMSACTVFIGLVSYLCFQLSHDANNIQKITERYVPQLRSVLKIEIYSQEIFRLQLMILAEIEDNIQVSELVNKSKKDWEFIDKLMSDLRSTEMTEALRELVSETQKSLDDVRATLEGSYTTLVDSATSVSEKRSSVDNIITSKEFHAQRDQLFLTLLKIDEYIDNYVSSQGAESLSQAKEALKIAVVTTGLVTLVLIALAIVFVGKIVRSIKTESQNLLKASLGLSTGSQQLKASAENLTKEVTQSASAIEETSASLTEISSIINANSEKIEKSEVLSNETVRVVANGKDMILKLVTTMKDISQSSKSISDIATLIEDIAFQTNLLALNASVEAARAGEHGRGFSVVADAVRSLAQKSSTSAQQVTQLIHKTLEHVSTGEKMADASRVAIVEVESTMDKLRSINQEIALASKEQNAGVNQIAAAVAQLDSSVQQNASTSEELASAAAGVSTESLNLEFVTKNLNFVIEGNNEDKKGQFPVTNAS